jgi:Heavy-metal resistance
MARQTAWVLALAITCVPALIAAERKGEQNRSEKPQSPTSTAKDKPPNASAAPDDRERRKWWLYNKAELGISEPQSVQINQIFEATISKLRDARKELDRAEEDLSRAIKEHKADLATITGLLDRVESARSIHNKTRTLMLYRMHLVLSADQRQKLEVLRERQAERKDSDAQRKDKDAPRKDKETPSERRHHP